MYLWHEAPLIMSPPMRVKTSPGVQRDSWLPLFTDAIECLGTPRMQDCASQDPRVARQPPDPTTWTEEPNRCVEQIDNERVHSNSSRMDNGLIRVMTSFCVVPPPRIIRCWLGCFNKGPTLRSSLILNPGPRSLSTPHIRVVRHASFFLFSSSALESHPGSHLGTCSRFEYALTLLGHIVFTSLVMFNWPRS